MSDPQLREENLGTERREEVDECPKAQPGFSLLTQVEQGGGSPSGSDFRP